MGLAKDIRTVTELKTKAAQVLDEINADRRPLIITQDGKPRAVMLDVESYDELRSAIGMLKLVALGEADMRKGKWVEQRELFDQLESRLKALGKHGPKKA